MPRYETGYLQVGKDDLEHFAFSNCFDIATASGPYEKVVLAATCNGVLEVLRAEGRSPWYVCAHDESALCMSEGVEIHLMQLDPSQLIPDKTGKGAVQLDGAPLGPKMGFKRLAPGYHAVLPANVAYQIRAVRPAAVILHTCRGVLSRVQSPGGNPGSIASARLPGPPPDTWNGLGETATRRTTRGTAADVSAVNHMIANQNGSRLPVAGMQAISGQAAPETEHDRSADDCLRTDSLFDAPSRHEVWHPSCVSEVDDSVLFSVVAHGRSPLWHDNERLQWLLQLSNEVAWDFRDRLTGRLRTRVVMKAGDIIGVPCGCSYQGHAKLPSLFLSFKPVS